MCFGYKHFTRHQSLLIFTTMLLASHSITRLNSLGGWRLCQSRHQLASPGRNLDCSMCWARLIEYLIFVLITKVFTTVRNCIYWIIYYDRSAMIRQHRHSDLIATWDSVKKNNKKNNNVTDFRSNKLKTCYSVKLYISLDFKGV